MVERVWRGPLGVSRGDNLTGLLVLRMVVSEEKFRGLEWGKKIQKLVVCMNVYMNVSIDEDKVVAMVQAMEDLLSSNGEG